MSESGTEKRNVSGHRDQHYVPVSYLKAWCDPSTSDGHEPYIWLFDKDGANPRKKAPRNVLSERELYTIRGVDGGRDLTLEHGLAELEGLFATLRESKLSVQADLDPTDFAVLCTFAAAMHGRTLAMRDHLQSQWGGALELMDKMKQAMDTATDEQRSAMQSMSKLPGSGPSLSYDEVRALAEQPLQYSMGPQVSVEASMLMAVCNALIFTTDADQGFITSDNPCVWHDPEAYKRPPFYRQPGLAYDTTEITLPLSPRHALYLNQRGLSGYLAAPDASVDEMNRRTRAWCKEHFVNNTNRTKPIWFDLGRRLSAEGDE